MPRLIVTPAARAGLDRCRRFLNVKSVEASKRAAAVIGQHFAQIEFGPAIGRPYSGDPYLRELLIPFGDSGYVALYVHDADRDEVLVLAFRHQKEAGY